MYTLHLLNLFVILQMVSPYPTIFWTVFRRKKQGLKFYQEIFVCLLTLLWFW